MADDENHLEEPALEPPESYNTHQRTGSASRTTQNADHTADTTAGPDAGLKGVRDVLNSEIGISTLLNRLKQSIASSKEFAVFLKKRSILEEDYSAGLRKLCRAAAESVKKSDQRHGSFLQSIDEVALIHERMADNGAQFAVALHQMHDELVDMTTNLERGRKHWKTAGLNAEQRASETDNIMRKSKAKYDALAEDYDRARTGDRQSGKIFGLKGPKSAAQHEEDLLRKVQSADTDYAQKVQVAQGSHTELWSKLRPEAVKALEDLIRECDSAVTLQMQKFASYNERLLLSNGLSVSPMGTDGGPPQPRSLREAIAAIDNDGDLNTYIGSHASKAPPRGPEIKYERHMVLGGSTQQTAPVPERQSELQHPITLSTRQGAQAPSYMASSPGHQNHSSQGANQTSVPAAQRHERNFSQDPLTTQHNIMEQPQPKDRGGDRPPSSSGPPQLSALPFQQTHKPQAPPPNQIYQGAGQINPRHSLELLPPVNRVFGRTLGDLFSRDQSPVPMIIYQCIQAVDLFGLEVEGIYRISGNSAHIQQMKAIFDNGNIEVDFRNPENFFHDVNSVTGLLKQFFRELPDPVLGADQHSGFIEAAQIEDPILRRDSLHSIINGLADPNYATLRALTLHLHRVQERSAINRMTASNIAIIWGPTLMGTGNQGGMQAAGWFVRVIQTILENTYQIFDED